jgi:hypothetical protein
MAGHKHHALISPDTQQGDDIMNRALLVGINTYPGAPLRGCVNDVVDMANFLVNRCGFKKTEIRLITDNRATTANIVQRLEWLVKDLKKGDRVFFQFSGHGTQMATRDKKQEIDGLDEVICPIDFDWTDEHTIRDKQFAKIFSKVPNGVEFVWVSDSCHSGDLTREISINTHRAYPCPADFAWRNEGAKDLKKTALGLTKAAKTINAALISGCRSDQTSADAIFANRPNGALTYFLLHELNKPKGQTLVLSSLIKAIDTSLKSHGYQQVPQLEGSAEIAKHGFLKI